MITLGQVIAYGIGAGFFHIHSGWRWMVGLGAVPAGIQTILLFFLPESRKYFFWWIIYGRCWVWIVLLARILLQKGDTTGALAVMTKIYAFAKPEEVDLKVCRNHFRLLLSSWSLICLGESVTRICKTKHWNHTNYDAYSTFQFHDFWPCKPASVE